MKRKIGKLCVITDTVVQKEYSHIDLAQMAIKGGAEIIQFRDKTMATGDLIKTARKLGQICHEANALFMINDRVDVALISDADGVHLGLEDIPVKDARRLLGRDKIIGGTAHSLNEAKAAEKSGADYIGFGHIFATGSKVKKTPPVGLDMLGEVVRAVNIPVLAIGGIDADNADKVMSTGVHGVAVIGAVAKSPNPTKTTKNLIEMIYAKGH